MSMDPLTGGRMHALILAGSAALAPTIGKTEAARLGSLIENGFLDSLKTDAERQSYYQGCDYMDDTATRRPERVRG